MKKKFDVTDIVGTTVGDLEIVKHVGSHRYRPNTGDTRIAHSYLCRCKCGKEKTIRRNGLICTYPTKSCGCHRKKSGPKGGPFDPTDIVDTTCYHFEILKYVGSRPKASKGNDHLYLCKCKCGTEKTLPRTSIITGHIKSCGCLLNKKGKDSLCWTGHGEISGRVWTTIKNRATKKGLDFDVTIEQAWKLFEKQNGKCELSGVPITLKGTKGDYADKTASLDRIDNTKGYVKNNIQWLHKDVNWMKGRFTPERFMELCNLISNHKGNLCC